MGELIRPNVFAWLGQSETDNEEQRAIALFTTPREALSSERSTTRTTREDTERSAPPSAWDDDDLTTPAEWRRVNRYAVRLDVLCVYLAVAGCVLFWLVVIAALVHAH